MKEGARHIDRAPGCQHPSTHSALEVQADASGGPSEAPLIGVMHMRAQSIQTIDTTLPTDQRELEKLTEQLALRGQELQVCRDIVDGAMKVSDDAHQREERTNSRLRAVTKRLLEKEALCDEAVKVILTSQIELERLRTTQPSVGTTQHLVTVEDRIHMLERFACPM